MKKWLHRSVWRSLLGKEEKNKQNKTKQQQQQQQTNKQTKKKLFQKNPGGHWIYSNPPPSEDEVVVIICCELWHLWLSWLLWTRMNLYVTLLQRCAWNNRRDFPNRIQEISTPIITLLKQKYVGTYTFDLTNLMGVKDLIKMKEKNVQTYYLF